MPQQKLIEYLQLLKIKSYKGEEAILLLKNIIGYIRPAKRKHPEFAIKNLTELQNLFEQDAILKAGFYDLIANIIIESNVTDLLTDNGLITGVSFAQQIRRIINDKMIPPYQEPDDIQTILQIVFYKKWDWLWLAEIPNEMLHPFVQQVHEAIRNKTNDLSVEIYNASKLISYRIASMGLEKEILIRANKKDTLLTPFIQQNIELNNYFNSDTQDVEAIHKIRLALIQCGQSLVQLEKNSAETGTSIHQTFLIRRLTENVNRLKFTISLLQKNKAINSNILSYFFKESILYLKTKNNLRRFASNNLNLLAYRIVDHTKDTGEKYITSNRKEYGKIFLSACGAGFIVSLMVMIKFKISNLHFPVFWESFAYSINYALGFVAIQLMGFTLATKQPAMTASTLANSLIGTRGKDFVQMATTISKVCRTQFVSILGNVFFVIPFTLLWLVLYGKIFETDFIHPDAAAKQLVSNHPFLSFSILYAAFAGLFLFISGLVSGYVDNRMVYAKIPERLPNQAFLKKLLPAKWLQKLIRLLKARSGAIFGNTALGIFLGMSSFFGKIFGLPIDIRHITFVAGNIAMGIYGGGSGDFNFILICLLGIPIVGLFNLFVSFTLAFYLAMKARSLHLSDYPRLGRMVLKHFFSTPKEFFFPPKNGKSAFLGKQDSHLFQKDLGIQ
jgi:site-specific recombinase